MPGATALTDATLRDLERCFRASGKASDEVAWLLERVRCGELTPEKLTLSAYLGHPALSGSRLYSGIGLPDVGDHHLSNVFGYEANVAQAVEGDSLGVIRVAVAALGPIARGKALAVAGPLTDMLVQFLDALEWTCSTPKNTRDPVALGALLVALSAQLEEDRDVLCSLWKQDVPLVELLLDVARFHLGEPLSCYGAWSNQASLVAQCMGWGYLCVLILPGEFLPDFPLLAHDSNQRRDTRNRREREVKKLVEAALYADLVPWVLGYSDPVHDRVAARRESTSE